MAAKKCKATGCRRTVKSPRALYCDDPKCLRARARARTRQARAPRAPEPEEPTRPAGGVFSATLNELTEKGRVHTPAAQNALALAVRIDNGADDSGSSIAALSKQHLAALAEALRDVDVEGDAIDELQARRSKRRASA